MFSYVVPTFLQMFLRDRFGALSPVPNEFKPVKTQKEIINGVERKRADTISLER